MPVSFEEVMQTGFAASSSSAATPPVPAKASTGLGGAPTTSSQASPSKGLSYEEVMASAPAKSGGGLLDAVGGVARKTGEYALEAERELTGAFYQGMVETGKGAALLASPIALLSDLIRSSASGKPSTEVSDAYFSTFVKPLEDEAGKYEVSKDASMVGKFSHSLGQAGSIIASALVTSPGSLVMKGEVAATETLSKFLAEKAGETAKLVRVPAISQGINTANDVYKETGDKDKAFQAGMMTYFTNLIAGMPAVSAEGNIVTRGVTGAASGVGASYAGRLGMEATLGNQPNYKVTEEDLVSGLVNSGFAVLVGTTPKQAAKILREKEAQGDNGFDNLVAKNKEAADKVVKHVEEVDPDLGKKLRQRKEKVEKKPEDSGEKEAKKKLEEPVKTDGWTKKVDDQGEETHTHDSGEFTIFPGKLGDGVTRYFLTDPEGRLHGETTDPAKIPELMEKGNQLYKEKSKEVVARWKKTADNVLANKGENAVVRFDKDQNKYVAQIKLPDGTIKDVGEFDRQDKALFETERALEKEGINPKAPPAPKLIPKPTPPPAKKPAPAPKGKKGKKGTAPTAPPIDLLPMRGADEEGGSNFVGPWHPYMNAAYKQTMRAVIRMEKILEGLLTGKPYNEPADGNGKGSSIHYLSNAVKGLSRSEPMRKLDKAMRDYYKVISDDMQAGSGKSVRFAKDILREMHLRAETPELKQFLQKMIDKMPEDLPVTFVKELNYGKSPGQRGADGAYIPLTREIKAGLDLGDFHTEQLTSTLIHEIAHSLESRFIRKNPNHPLVRRLNQLFIEAEYRAQRMSQKFDTIFQNYYGLSRDAAGNPKILELLAEARANDSFRRFLIASEEFASTGWMQRHEGKRSILSQLADISLKILGLKPKDARLFDQILSVGEAIQKRQYNKGLSHGVNYSGGAEAWPHITDTVNEIPEVIASGTGPFETAKDTALNNTAVRRAEGKLREYWRAALQTFYPEGFGDRAKKSAVIVARVITELKAKDAMRYGQSEKRRSFWNKNQGKFLEFIDNFEKGVKFNDSMLQKAADHYQQWMKDLYEQDRIAGIKYDPENNYITHLFEKPDEVDKYMTRRYGNKWGDPYFMKDRVGKTFKELVDYGRKLEAQGQPNPFKPKYNNIEDIMLARDHASNVAAMQVDMLRSLAREGMAVRIKVGRNGALLTKRPEGYSEAPRRAPNGEKYWIHEEADTILHNAFDTKSLWNLQGPLGDAFRGAMGIKNTVVPIRLLGLFHAVHVGAVINNASALTRATKQLLLGNVDPKNWAADLIRGVVPLSGTKLIDYVRERGPSRILQAYWGKLPADQLNGSEKMLLQYMNEGGLVPGMSAQDRLSTKRKFMDALEQGKYLKAGFRLPGAIIQSLQDPMFHVWIPDMKIAAFARDAATAMQLNPNLHTDPMARQMMMRKIAKSIDNRFGEMSYDTLFWNRTIKDLTVLNTLSLGWQLGFIREYGGGAVQIVKAPFAKGSLREKLAKGDLDKALFASYYVGLATLYTGVLSYALSGNPPSGLDYFYPQSGEEDKEGKPRRLNTPFFTREFVSIQKHMENEGPISGLGHLAANKASGVIGLLRQTFMGVNSLGQEVRDPNAPAYRQLEQTLSALIGDIQPISVEAMKDPTTVAKERVLSIGGFSAAPKYVTETPLEGEVRSTFLKYYGQPTTSYDRALYSEDARRLKKVAGKDEDKAQALMDAMEVKYDLTPSEVHRLYRAASSEENMYVKMFGRMDWRQQKAILDKYWKSMTEDEQDEFLKHSNKEHLRNNYEPPED